MVHEEREGAERDPGGGEDGLPGLPPALPGRDGDPEEEEPDGERRAEFRTGKRRPPDGDERRKEVERVLPREVEGEAIERDGEEEGDEAWSFAFPDQKSEEQQTVAASPKTPAVGPRTSRKMRKATTARGRRQLL